MNVASKTLCEELYEATGWVPEHYEPEYFKEKHVPPPYAIGFLLSKLPPRHFLANKIETKSGHPYYEASIRERNGTKGLHIVVSVCADTPADALAKLALELFKQGVLAAASPQQDTNKKESI